MTEQKADQYVQFSLREIADKLADKTLRLPAVQRGSVWNAGKALALWDSLLRGFPIGTFSVKTVKGNDGSTVFDLLDGQQRATAIAMGLSYPPKEDDSPILWVDLGDHGKDRIRLFVTTPAHPWGYKATEKPFEPPQKLTPYQQREAVRGLDGRWSHSAQSLLSYQKPKARELYPVEAMAPIPMAIALEAWKRCATVTELKAYCETRCEAFANWVQRGNLSEKAWEQFKAQIEACGLEHRVVFGMSADNVRPEDYGDYFERIGRGGVVPSIEEIEYSKLKVELEEEEPGAGDALRKTMEKLAKGLTSSSRLAHIAGRIYKSQTNGCSRKTFFQEIFKKRFEQCVKTLKKGLLPWHISQLCEREAGVLMEYLLSQEEVTPEHIGLVMLLLSYCQDGRFRHTLENIKSKGLKHGLKVAFCEYIRGKPWVQVPLLKDDLEAPAIEEVAKGYGDVGMMSILLSGCHDFIKALFPDYTDHAAQWEEDGCPWDYDHIIPSAWFDKVDKELWQLKDSIGNLAPLPYSLNRSKSDGAPGRSYPLQENAEVDGGLSGQLCLEPYETVLKAASNASCLEDKAFRAKLKQAIVERFKRLYAHWLERFHIAALLDYASALKECPKYHLLSGVKEALKDETFKLYYNQGRYDYADFNPARPIEWFTHWWHTLGCVVGKMFVCLTTDDDTWYVGVAKLPSEESTSQAVRASLTKQFPGLQMDKGDYWYWYSLEDSGTFSAMDVPTLVKALSERLQKLKGALLAQAAQ